MTEFRKGLESLINRHSAENGSNTPDFILAEYLTDALSAFDKATSAREQWYGWKHSPGGGDAVHPKDKPTIAELESMLDAKGAAINILPDGSIHAT